MVRCCGSILPLTEIQLDFLDGALPRDSVSDETIFQAVGTSLVYLGVLRSASVEFETFRVPPKQERSLPCAHDRHERDLRASFGVLGLPWDFANGLGGASVGPSYIRAAWRHLTIDALRKGFYSHRLQRNVLASPIYDWGNLGGPVISSYQEIGPVMNAALAQIAKTGAFPLCLGGDHGLTFKILEALPSPASTLIVLDAHDDFGDLTTDNRGAKKINHGNWIRATCESGLVSNILIFGPRGFAPVGRGAELAKSGIEVISAEKWASYPKILSKVLRDVEFGPVYLSIDIDVLDPSIAPGTPCLLAGGVSIALVEDFIFELSQLRPIVGLDVMEVSAPRGSWDLTPLVASSLAFFAAHVIGAAAPAAE